MVFRIRPFRYHAHHSSGKEENLFDVNINLTFETGNVKRRSLMFQKPDAFGEEI